MASQAFIDKLQSKSARRLFKIEALDSDTEEVIAELSNRVIDGSITISDGSGSRVSATITFENTDGIFTPQASGYIWKNKKFLISTGLVLDDGSEEYVVRGIFVVGEPEVVSEFSDTEVSIQFYDKFCLINGELRGKLKTMYNLPVSSSIFDSVTAVLSEVNEPKPAIIEPTSETLPYTLIKNGGGNYGEILQEIGNMISWKFFYDNQGYPRLEEPTNVETAPVAWTFSTNEVTYMGARHRYQFSETYNSVVVVGSVLNGDTFRATSQDTSSDIGINSDVGECVLYIEDSLIYSQDLAQQRSDYELSQAIQSVENIDITCLPIDILNVGDVIELTDSQLNLDAGRYLIKQINFPLMNDTMTLTVWKGRVIE